MRLLGLIAYFDESPDAIERCVTELSMLGVSDIYAVDGAYRLFPDGRGTSDQAREINDVLARMTSECGMNLTTYTPAGVYMSNEVEKRQLMLDLALVRTGPDDWIIWYDADFTIEDGSRDLRPDLEVLTHAGARWADVEINDSTHLTLGWYKLRLLWRAVPGMRFVRNHFTIRYHDGVETIVQPKQHDAPGHQLGVRIRHALNDRAPGRRERQVKYYENRERLGTER